MVLANDAPHRRRRAAGAGSDGGEWRRVRVGAHDLIGSNDE